MKYAVYLLGEFQEYVFDMDKETIESFYPKSFGYLVKKC